MSWSAPQRRSRLRHARRQPCRLDARGYTVVEVMMALAILSVGVTGVIAMQGVTAASNRHAKNLAVATHIAQGWLDMLATESSLWTETGSLNRTTWLKQTGSEVTWFRPEYSSSLNFGPAFDALGNSVNLTNLARDTEYCADLRLTSLRDTSGGAGLIRAEVRVFWRREDIVLLPATTAPAHACALESVAVTADSAGNMFHFVYMSTAVREQTRGDSP
jgi:prepilin-type N-terminal cleavage/methylation domain-containing protein